MPVWRRYLVKEPSGRMVELPTCLYDRADDGTAPLPHYAGRCVEVVAAVLVGAPGGAPQLAEMAFTKLYFDQSGYLDAAKRERMIRLMLESCADRRCRSAVNPAGSRPGCAALSRRAGEARHQLMREFGWNPAPEELDAALHQLDAQPAPGSGNGGAAPTLH